jgi:hypothetical protein
MTREERFMESARSKVGNSKFLAKQCISEGIIYYHIIEGEPAEKVVLHYFLVICAQFVLNK